jgi:DNA polymerase III delta prime subunit
VVPELLKVELLKRAREQVLRSGKVLALLEHQWNLPEHFVHSVFGQQEGEQSATLANQEERHLRPDILLLQPPEAEEERWFLDASGEMFPLPEEMSEALPVSFVDIKQVRSDRVGRRHFAELLFYAHGFAHWLKDNGLAHEFYVSVRGHGILGYADEDELYTLSVDSLRTDSSEQTECLTPLVWENTSHLFSVAAAEARRLWQTAQETADVDSVSLCLQDSCGSCPFVDDCVSSLQHGAPDEPELWDVRLIPYLQPAVAEQLHALGIRTLGELERGLDSLELGETPQPLHAELPTLRLRAQALLSQQKQLPCKEEGVLSLALPKRVDLSLVFDAETDMVHEQMFAFALSLDVNAPWGTLREVHNRWWSTWREWLDSPRQDPDSLLRLFSERLETNLLKKYWYKGDDFDKQLEGLLLEMSRALRFLLEEDALSIILPGESYTLGNRELVAENCLVRVRYVHLSGGLEPQHEFNLLRTLIRYAHAVLRLCSITEMLCIAEHDSGRFMLHLSFAGFYWSSEQIRLLQELLERHLPALEMEPELRTRFEEVVHWISPVNSDVRHPALHKKMYDLRGFVESVASFPNFINFTWHKTLAHYRDGFVANEQYWAPHFNYLDPAVWHAALEELDTRKRASLESSLRLQLEIKVNGLQQIRRSLHREVPDLLARESKPMKTRDFRSMRRDNWHRLGSLWKSYNQLNAAVQELQRDATRLYWPEHGIAKLKAGAATNLHYSHEEMDKATFEVVEVEMQGLSSHMKLKLRDSVLLLHHSMRDRSDFPYHNLKDLCEFTVRDMEWNAHRKSYLVRLQRRKKLSFDRTSGALKRRNERGEPLVFECLLEEKGTEGWHLYESGMDVWTGRLATNKDALFQRFHLGRSWLAERLLYLGGLNGEVLEPPDSLTVQGAELYSFAPGLLPTAGAKEGESTSLQTPVRWRPDPSQEEGILKALEHPVFCLQGPPGTGKSQTIAALIDDFLHRHGRPARILVSAFSYAALEVVLEKLRESREGDGPDPDPGRPSKVALLPMFYAASTAPEEDAFPGLPEQPPVMHLKFDGGGCDLDGERVRFNKAPRGACLFERAFRAKGLDWNDGSFVLFANAHSLYRLGTFTKPGKRKYLKPDFGFDLIVIDEASQMPADYFTAISQLVKPFEATLDLPEEPAALEQQLMYNPEQLLLKECPGFEELSRVVLVGDQEQLPPVQPMKPPTNLKPYLDSVFRYFLEAHETPSHQLQRNYRSHRDIVYCIEKLGLYEGLHAFHQDDGFLEAIPSSIPPEIEEGWLRQLLAPSQVVSTLLHDEQWDTLLSPVEAELTARVLLAHFRQKGIDSPEKERRFWQEDVGVVAPHNAHGRLIVRRILEGFKEDETLQSTLPEEELMELLRSGVVSVEKFQGSDRSFIVGSFGVSSTDQLASEEDFLYDLNRFNVLISRAKHKMLLICSRNFLQYVPRDRDVMGVAARIREYAQELCSQSILTESSVLERTLPLELRWMSSTLPEDEG